VAALGGKLYVFGGYPFACCNNYPWPYGADNAWEYNPKTNTWRTLAPVPRKIGAGMAAPFDGKIYVMAGTDSGQFHSIAAVHEYDPANNTWRARASMRNAREHVKGAVVDSLIFVIGGHSLQGSSKVNQAAVEAYSPRSNTWYDKGTMPSPRGGHGVAYLGGKLYVFGGEAANFSVSSRVDQFDPVTNAWAKVNDIPSTSGIHAQATVVWNGRAHLVAGSNPGGFQPKSSHVYFTPPEVPGCTQPAAPNYNRYATRDDGSCQAVAVLRGAGAGGPRILAGGDRLRLVGLAPGSYRVQVLDPLGRGLASGAYAAGGPGWSLPGGTVARFLRVEGAGGAAVVRGAALPR
jgi:N-acetylneuraminic acid mutarotase